MSAEFERLIVDAKRRFQIALDCARLFERVFDIAHPVEHDGELAAVEVCHQIVGADKLLQAPADVLQHAIAHLEAKRVVDVVEAVERHDQQPDLVVGRRSGNCSRRYSTSGIHAVARRGSRRLFPTPLYLPVPGVVPPPSLESSAAVPARSASGCKCSSSETRLGRPVSSSW